MQRVGQLEEDLQNKDTLLKETKNKYRSLCLSSEEHQQLSLSLEEALASNTALKTQVQSLTSQLDTFKDEKYACRGMEDVLLQKIKLMQEENKILKEKVLESEQQKIHLLEFSTTTPLENGLLAVNTEDDLREIAQKLNSQFDLGLSSHPTVGTILVGLDSLASRQKTQPVGDSSQSPRLAITSSPPIVNALQAEVFSLKSQLANKEQALKRSMKEKLKLEVRLQQAQQSSRR